MLGKIHGGRVFCIAESFPNCKVVQTLTFCHVAKQRSLQYLALSTFQLILHELPLNDVRPSCETFTSFQFHFSFSSLFSWKITWIGLLQMPKFWARTKQTGCYVETKSRVDPGSCSPSACVMNLSTVAINAVKRVFWVIWLTNTASWVINKVFWIINRVF